MKEEIQDLKIGKERYKRMYEVTLPLQNENKQEIFKQYLEKLIFELQLKLGFCLISVKIKEILIMIMKLVEYPQEQINDIFNRKEGKKGFFGGIFSGKK